MSGVPKIRGKVNIVLNRLVREGVITGFRTNFDFPDGILTPQVMVSASEEWSPEAARLLVMDALADVAVGISVAIADEQPP